MADQWIVTGPLPAWDAVSGVELLITVYPPDEANPEATIEVAPRVMHTTRWGPPLPVEKVQ